MHMYTRLYRTDDSFTAELANKGEEEEDDDEEEDGKEQINGKNLIVAIGVPDGVSPIVNETRIDPNTTRRLYIFANEHLSEETLETLDKKFGKEFYPIFTITHVYGNKIDEYPKENFYFCENYPTNIEQFTEYRYLQYVHRKSRIVFEANNKNVYKLVLPYDPLLVIVMPSNFIRTSYKYGYFKYDNGLIINVFSKYFLSSNTASSKQFYVGSANTNEISPQDRLRQIEISNVNLNDARLKAIIEKLFLRLGMQNIISTKPDQIYSYNKYITMVVGNTNDIIWY